MVDDCCVNLQGMRPTSSLLCESPIYWAQSQCTHMQSRLIFVFGATVLRPWLLSLLQLLHYASIAVEQISGTVRQLHGFSNFLF